MHETLADRYRLSTVWLVILIGLLTFSFCNLRDYSNDPRVVEIREIQEEARKQYLSNGGGPSTQS